MPLGGQLGTAHLMPYFRTGVTSLCDDGLVVLDILFKYRTAAKYLRADGFRPQWNLPFSHKLDDGALARLLKKYVDDGILTQSEDYFCMTPHGGALWEAERMPVWERFATGRCEKQFLVDANRGIGRLQRSFCFVAEDVADEFCRHCATLGLGNDPHTRIKRHVVHRFEDEVPWKPMSPWYVVLVSTRDIVNGPRSRSGLCCAYDKMRCAESATLTWNSIVDLQKFV